MQALNKLCLLLCNHRILRWVFWTMDGKQSLKLFRKHRMSRRLDAVKYSLFINNCRFLYILILSKFKTWTLNVHPAIHNLQKENRDEAKYNDKIYQAQSLINQNLNLDWHLSWLFNFGYFYPHGAQLTHLQNMDVRTMYVHHRLEGWKIKYL